MFHVILHIPQSFESIKRCGVHGFVSPRRTIDFLLIFEGPMRPRWPHGTGNSFEAVHDHFSIRIWRHAIKAALDVRERERAPTLCG